MMPPRRTSGWVKGALKRHCKRFGHLPRERIMQRTRGFREDRINSPACARRAFSIVYVGVVLFAMLAVVSLAVDMGRLRVARVQLQTAADASALAGAQQVPNIWLNTY